MADVLLVEPWMKGSHQAWAEGYRRNSSHAVELLGETPRGWRDTIDSSAARLAKRVVTQPNVIVASSMLDLTRFLEASGLSNTPALLYFHENQLTYDRAKADPARGSVNWKSAIAADRVAFNSRFHVDDFFEAVPQLGVERTVASEMRRRASVLPVGIDVPAAIERVDRAPTVLWSHRWEYDKDPDTFIAALGAVADVDYRLILTGEGRASSRYHTAARQEAGDRLIHAGYVQRSDYLALLARSDLVVSTARQEFFGVSVAEAMSAGAVPLVPNRLAYPELLGPGLARCLYEPGRFGERLRLALTQPDDWLSLRPAARAAGSRFSWELVAPRYDELIDSMV